MSLLPKIFRSICYPLVSQKSTYYLGMVFVRLSRKLRSLSYKKNGVKENFAEVNVFDNVKMEVGLHTYMGGSIYWYGMHHVNEIIFLKRFLKPHFTFVDVGANQGEFSLFAASKLSKGKVISFEPVQKQRDMLLKNISLNGYSNIEVNAYGLSDKKGQLPVYTSSESEIHSGIHEGLSSMYKSDKLNEIEQTIELKVFDDEYFHKLKSFDFMKIDIEGAELYAMKGMKKSIAKFKPVILIEINNDTFNAGGYTTEDVLKFLFEMGYEIYNITKGNLIKQDVRHIEKWGNYVFKCPE